MYDFEPCVGGVCESGTTTELYNPPVPLKPPQGLGLSQKSEPG